MEDNQKYITGLAILLVILVFFSTRQPNSELSNLSKESMNDNNQQDEIKQSTEGLKIEILEEGSGERMVVKNDTITVNYVGTLESGEKFDSSFDRNEPFVTKIGVGDVIKGWDEGMIGMRIGETRRLTIDSDLAYGDNGIPGVIPGGATLIFEVNLISIE